MLFGVLFGGSSPRVRGTHARTLRHRGGRRFIPACAGNSAPNNELTAAQTVHPRVCGELAAGGAVDQERLRFIPACAGNSSCGCATGGASSVHPRVCGELIRAGIGMTPNVGSSPRVRGTLNRPPCRAVTNRFIPACAGNSLLAAVEARLVTVHPRVCGELSAHASFRRHMAGSSPRVRGTPTSTTRMGSRCRFIPACAGNSRPRRPSRRGRPVHPRVCGELPRERKARGALVGSSPRVRGTRRHADAGPDSLRFIPACAGNSQLPPSKLSTMSVHPRVCGELRARGLRAAAGLGSSPRVRGTPHRRSAEGSLWRFIPACAGNSIPAGLQPDSRTVHPRVCGELALCAGAAEASAGSSPRVRGTPHISEGPTARRPVHPRVCGELSSG